MCESKMKRGRAWGLLALFVLGLALWAAGSLNLLGEHRLLTLCFLLAGGILIAAAGLLLLGTPASGTLQYGRDGVLWFCGAFGVGVASLGFAISPLTSWWWPALIFVAGGVSLMVWAAGALGMKRP